jgi:serine/threonine protein kinase
VGATTNNEPRILIVEPDPKIRAALLRFVVKGWRGGAVQSTSGTLEDIVGDAERLGSFDVLLVGCDFAADGTANNPTLRALRAVTANPANPTVILLTNGGSEYTAVQAIKSGAFDYVPKELMGREQVVRAVHGAMLHRKDGIGSRSEASAGPVRLFGYDIRKCLATRDNVSVHVAFSAERGKEVVLKVLHRGRGALSRDDSFESLVGELKLLYDVDDPAVAEIYDFRVTNQYCYIAMEYFPLGHLGTRLTQRLEPAAALRNTTEIAHALSIIHTAGIIHRDLKPGNIMLRDDGTIALIDFGISQSANVDAMIMGNDEVAGTPYYMSPEQVRGRPTDERTDLYALGVILYQMLTGEKPYSGETTAEILEGHLSAPVPRLPEELSIYQGLVTKLLEKDAAQRMANARELIEAIEAIERSPSPSAESPEEPLPAVAS